MMKNIKTQLIFMLLGFIFMSSCSTDENNYNYKEINEVVFDGLQTNYVGLLFEEFSIATDQIKFTKDADGSGNYEYSWEAVSENNELFKLSSEKALNTKLELLPGEYALFYFVKDLNTGVEFQYRTTLEVVSSIYKGWMVLNDVAGNSRLDMVTWMEGDSFKEIHDVLDFAGSELELSGTPGFVKCYPLTRTDGKNIYGIYVSTSGNGTTRIEQDVFSWDLAYNLSFEFASEQPENLEASVMKPRLNVLIQGVIATIANSNLYISNIQNQVKYNAPLNKTSSSPTLFDISPYIAAFDNDFAGYWIFFDNTNKRFVYHQANSISYCSNIANTYASPLFTPGKDLKYMTWVPYGNNKGTAYAVLNDPADGKNYIGGFVHRFQNIFEPNIYDEITATNFDQAEHITIDPTYAYIIYNVGSKVYEYDIFTKTTKEMLDKGNLEITKLEYGEIASDFSSGIEAEMAKQLIVCTYDPSGTEGSNGVMELYNVPGIQGQLELAESYTGFGKIVSVAYRAR